MIDVSLPASVEEGEKYPVILVTDGNLFFDLVQSVAHGRSQMLGSIMPPAVLVGVGYPGDEGAASFYALSLIHI